MSAEAVTANGKCAVLAAGTKPYPKLGLTMMPGLLGNGKLKLKDASSHELFVICTS